MADENAPCADLVEQRLKARSRLARIVELETALAKAEEDRNCWATDALEEVTRVWAAKDNTDRWRRYAEHWRGRVRGASEAVRAAMEQERSAWTSWHEATDSLYKERAGAKKAEAERDRWRETARRLAIAFGADREVYIEKARRYDAAVAEREWLRRRVAELEAEREEWRQSREANAAEMMRYQIAANRLEGERDRLTGDLKRCRTTWQETNEARENLLAGNREFRAERDRLQAELREVLARERVSTADPELGSEDLAHYYQVIRAITWEEIRQIEAERDRLSKIVSSMYAALGADLESGDDPAAEVARCVAERDRLVSRVAELERVLELASQAFAGIDGGLSAVELITRLQHTTMEDIARRAVAIKLDAHKGNRLCRAALSGTPMPYPRRRKAKPDLAQYQAELEAEIDLDRGVTGAEDLPTSGRW